MIRTFTMTKQDHRILKAMVKNLESFIMDAKKKADMKILDATMDSDPMPELIDLQIEFTVEEF